MYGPATRARRLLAAKMANMVLLDLRGRDKSNALRKLKWPEVVKARVVSMRFTLTTGEISAITGMPHMAEIAIAAATVANPDVGRYFILDVIRLTANTAYGAGSTACSSAKSVAHPLWFAFSGPISAIGRQAG